jgi:hypothetical protein
MICFPTEVKNLKIPFSTNPNSSVLGVPFCIWDPLNFPSQDLARYLPDTLENYGINKLENTD